MFVLQSTVSFEFINNDQLVTCWNYNKSQPKTCSAAIRHLMIQYTESPRNSTKAILTWSHKRSWRNRIKWSNYIGYFFILKITRLSFQILCNKVQRHCMSRSRLIKLMWSLQWIIGWNAIRYTQMHQHYKINYYLLFKHKNWIVQSIFFSLNSLQILKQLKYLKYYDWDFVDASLELLSKPKWKKGENQNITEKWCDFVLIFDFVCAINLVCKLFF